MLSMYKCKDKTIFDIAKIRNTNSISCPYNIRFSSVKMLFLKVENKKLNKKCAKIDKLNYVVNRVRNKLPMKIEDVALYYDMGDTTIRRCYKRYLKDNGKPKLKHQTIRIKQDFLKYFNENCIK